MCYGVNLRGVPTRLKFRSPDLLQRKFRQVLYSLETCLGLTFCAHCILLCVPNSAPVLKVLVASLLSCSLVLTERQIWVQHLGWCELVLCSLICNIKSFWLGMLNAAQDCLQAGAGGICPSDKIICFEKHVTLCVNFLKDHHNGLCNCIHLNLKPCPQRGSKCATIQLSKHIIHFQSADIQTAIPQCKELQPVLADLPLLQSMCSTAGYL